MPPPEDDEPGRPQTMLLANAVFAVRFPAHPFSRSLRHENPQSKLSELEAHIRGKAGTVAAGLGEYLFQRKQVLEELGVSAETILPVFPREQPDRRAGDDVTSFFRSFLFYSLLLFIIFI